MAKIKASQIIADIRAGLSDNEIMAKYGASETALKGIFKQLIGAELLTQEDLDQRIQKNRLTECPACGFLHDEGLTECPRCGVVKAKFLAKRQSGEEDVPAKRTPQPPEDIEKAEKFWPASASSRFFACLLDFIPIGFGFAVIIGFPLASTGYRGGISSGAGEFLGALGAFVAVYGYFAGMESFANGATLFKKKFKIRVVTIEGYPPGFLHALWRTFLAHVCISFWVWVFGSILGIFLYLVTDKLRVFDEEGRMWHDRITNTRVVEAE